MPNKSPLSWLTGPTLASLLVLLSPIFSTRLCGQQKQSPPAAADQVTADPKTKLLVGMTSALSGPAGNLGQSVKLGVEAYFALVNEQGGVHGKELSLIALDDGYQPASAAKNMRRLIHREKVIALIGNVGTPTAMVTVPIARREKVLLFGAFTGAGVLRPVPPERYVINVRASYEDETATIIKTILEQGIKPEEIAFFTQNDAYGDAGYAGAVKALQRHGFRETSKLAHGRYERNTQHVEDGLLNIFDAPQEPRAIVMVGAYRPCARFIQLAKTIFPEVSFYNVSFVGSSALAEALGAGDYRVTITQVVPHFASDLPAVVAYRRALKKFKPAAKPNFVSLEGFLAAQIFVAGLKRVAGTVTREKLIDAIESIKELDIGIGVAISFSDKDHQALHRVWTTRLKEGSLVAVD